MQNRETHIAVIGANARPSRKVTDILVKAVAVQLKYCDLHRVATNLNWDN